MCGIAGLVARERIDESALRLMGARLAHRGPDDHGTWIDPEARIGFAHRRLSIVDLSPAGHQPMASRNGRWMLSFNGEIYNHVELRVGLEAQGAGPPAAGEAWRGHSDTETLVECIAAWGLVPTIQRCVGMFALAAWDQQERRLHLIRDRFGEKPLYYGWVGRDFAFASELKTIRALPGFANPVSRRALSIYTRFGYVPAPWSIFERIYKLEPGCVLSASIDELGMPLDEPAAAGGPLVTRYWSYHDVVGRGLADPITDEQEATERLEQTLSEAVRAQSIADVPVGAFLSGGIDSSTVVALLRQHSQVRTFTIGFEDAAFDEAPYARAVAQHLGTEHHEALVTVREAQDVIPLISSIYDEPFGDSSQIPTYLICRHARQQVKVALTGDGGDEMFGGYNRYVSAGQLWSRMSRLPTPLRVSVGRRLGSVPAHVWNGAADLLGRRSRQPHFGTKVRNGLRAMATARSIDDLHDGLVDEWHAGPAPVEHGNGTEMNRQSYVGPAAPDAVRMMYRDATSYLPDDILCKIDRAAMAVSLETRVPLLDHRLAVLAARIPIEFNISGGVGKQMLRKLLFSHVPAKLFDRPKTGFAVPVGEWLKGPLRPWAEDLLNERKLRDSGYFKADPIRQRWRDHLEGRQESTAALWFILMFQAWSTDAHA